MRPLQLSMKGFGAFREQTSIDFTDIDLMALVGPTGSGKSTIIDAITFALYGTVARYEDNHLVAPAINPNSNEARVSLDFEVNGQVFTAVRIVRRTPSGGATTREARLERGADVLASDARSMSNEVEALLRVDVEQFNRTVVLPQGKFAAFLHDKPSDRQTTLVQLLGVELYRRIGKEARKRSTACNNKADALRSEHDEAAEEVADKRRADLNKRITTLNVAWSQHNVDCVRLHTLDPELSSLNDRIKSLSDKIHRMGMVTVPANLTALANQITGATKVKADAETLSYEWKTVRRVIKEALKTGPDITTLQLGFHAHNALAERAQELDNVNKRLNIATIQYESATRAANQVRETQEELNRCADETRATEAKARTAHDAEVTVTQIDVWVKLHSRYKAAIEESATTTQAAISAEEAILPLCKTRKYAVSAAEVTAARVAELQSRFGVLGHTDLLEVGEDCPLCLQEVHELPAHNFNDPDLGQAREDQTLAITALAAANEVYSDASAELIKLRAEASSALRTAQYYQSDIASIPPSELLGELRAKATQLAKAVHIAKNATGKAEAAAQQHRQSTAYTKAIEAEKHAYKRVTQLKASTDAIQTFLTFQRDKVATLPSKGELQGQLEEAKRLHNALEEADSRLDDVETQYKMAATQLRELNSQREQAITLLNGSRDQVAAYEPPSVDATDLVAAWTALTGWAQDQAHTAETERKTGNEEKSQAENRRAVLLDTLRARCDDVLDQTDPSATVEDLGHLLAAHLTTAKNELKNLDQRRDYLRKLKKRIDNLTQQAQVTNKLGHLLRTDGFESWLMETALHRLVEQATLRLLVLSNGQYSLEIHERDFFVRDHTNADELRRARTLSGGETFLASLSLALAIADTTAEVSTGDVPTMESIFLDEGFGTLDPHTLDTVAAAIEELGASGRLVGVVTHIRELADRMPVRLELTKTGGSATVERIEN